MAAKTVEKLIRELDCAVCMNTLKNPKSLSCRHSFCEECLKQCNNTSQSGSGEIKCPMCREVTILSGEGVADLKSIPLICRVLEVLEAKKNSTQIMCDACGDSESPLTTYCRDCLHFICDSCASSHAKMKLLMKDHRTVPLDMIENGTMKIKWMEEGLWRKPHECGEHSGELQRFYCRTCKLRICRDCIVLDHTKPDHDCTTVQKMFQETQEKVKDRLKSCKDKEKHVSIILNDVDVRETGANQKFHIMKERIRDLKSKAVANLNKAEEELLQKVEVLEEKFNKKLQDFRDNMNTTKENLTRAQSKAKEVVSAKEVIDISRGPFLPEDVLKELEELIASDVTMTLSMDLMALKATMIQGSKLPEQMARFAKLSLPHIWRETQMFPIPDKDITNIFSNGNSMYVACKKGIYKQLLSHDADPSTWMKLHHNVSIKQVVDMAISLKDQTFSFIAENDAACTQLFRLKLDNFPTSHGYGVPSTSGETVGPCPLNPNARITVDSQSRIIVADNNPDKTTDPAPLSYGSKSGQPSAATASPPTSLFGNRIGKPSTATPPFPTSFGSKPRTSIAPTAPVPASFGFTFGASSAATLRFKPAQASATTEPAPASLGFKLDQIPKRSPPGGFSFGEKLPQQLKVTSICSSQTASAGTIKFGNTENKPSSSAQNGKEGKAESGLPIPTTSTTIYRGKPRAISSPCSQSSRVIGIGSSQLSSDSFKVPLDRVQSLAAAKTGQLVFLRWDKKAVVITDQDGRIQHEIKEPGRMYLSISCTESDALFVLSASWGSHIVTLTKHSLEDGGLLEYIIDELDVSANFQSDEWPVIGNNGNDLVVINIGEEIRVYSAEDWD